MGCEGTAHLADGRAAAYVRGPLAARAPAHRGEAHVAGRGDGRACGGQRRGGTFRQHRRRVMDFFWGALLRVAGARAESSARNCDAGLASVGPAAAKLAGGGETSFSCETDFGCKAGSGCEPDSAAGSEAGFDVDLAMQQLEAKCGRGGGGRAGRAGRAGADRCR